MRSVKHQQARLQPDADHAVVDDHAFHDLERAHVLHPNAIIDPALGQGVALGPDLDRATRAHQRDLLSAANHDVRYEHVDRQRSAGRQRALQATN